MSRLSQETTLLIHFRARGENSPWWIITFPLILHPHFSPARAAAVKTTRLALEKSRLPAALQLTAIAPAWAGKGPPQKPSIGTGRSSELPAFVLPEGIFSTPGSQVATEKHPRYHRAWDHQNLIFQCLDFLIICAIIFHTCLPPSTSLPLSVPEGWWPCCWQPLEDAPRDLGGGSSGSVWLTGRRESYQSLFWGCCFLPRSISTRALTHLQDNIPLLEVNVTVWWQGVRQRRNFPVAPNPGEASAGWYFRAGKTPQGRAASESPAPLLAWRSCVLQGGGCSRRRGLYPPFCPLQRESTAGWGPPGYLPCTQTQHPQVPLQLLSWILFPDVNWWVGLLGQPCSPLWPGDYPVSCSCQLTFYKSISRFQPRVYLLSFSALFLSPALLPRFRDGASPGSK